MREQQTEKQGNGRGSAAAFLSRAQAVIAAAATFRDGRGEQFLSGPQGRSGKRESMESMDYEAFRRELKKVFADCKPWNVTFDWEEDPEEERDDELDTMELELETGPVYDLRIVSVKGMYDLYRRKGWEAVIKEMQNRPAPVRRRRGEDYRLLLNDEGKELYDELRELRAEIARERHIPPYIIFMNRTIYEMVKMLPVNEEQLSELYGVGEVNAANYGAAFLDKIKEYTGGVWREMLIVK